VVIGFSGGTGAGKTTLVEYAASMLGKENTLIITQDHYYKNHPELTLKECSQINFDHPNAIDFELLTEHIRLLQAGKNIRQPIYSFEKHLRETSFTLCTPKRYILVEGILIFTCPSLVDRFDYMVYIEGAKDIRMQRRIARDVALRGRTEKEVRKRFSTTLHSMHDIFIAPQKQKADLIITNNTTIQTATKQLSNWIKTIRT